ncbi:MAG: hypothetical protein A3G87_02915 [Omnitrophica bacterium RIFCSPLOWO2_12_FULL_50_11]|nr:MAG: hypothetical protein A3G87_02915 [Omnitrophica bacterium RIFCSPLOWO2_12_FULL_50_11]
MEMKHEEEDRLEFHPAYVLNFMIMLHTLKFEKEVKDENLITAKHEGNLDRCDVLRRGNAFCRRSFGG